MSVEFCFASRATRIVAPKSSARKISMIRQRQENLSSESSHEIKKNMKCNDGRCNRRKDQRVADSPMLLEVGKACGKLSVPSCGRDAILKDGIKIGEVCRNDHHPECDAARLAIKSGFRQCRAAQRMSNIVHANRGYKIILPSKRRRNSFVLIPAEYPTRDPPEPTMRWQGMMMGTGFAPVARPTAWNPFGTPTRLAS